MKESMKVKNENLKVDNSSTVKNKSELTFVQDKFFETGNWWLKIRQVMFNFLFLLVLVLPVLVLFNSISDKRIWDKLYYWTYQDGFELTDYLRTSILLALVVILVFSLIFLFRNNYMEKKVFPYKKTYNEQKLHDRKLILNKMYTERFGPKEFRESTRYYVVEGEKNLPDRMVDELFKEGKVEIK